MNDIDRSTRATVDTSPATLATAWLAAFETALTARDTHALSALFVSESHWRDILAFTWTITPTVGREAIIKLLTDRQAATSASNFRLAANRTPPRRVKRLGADVIEAIYEFETPTCRGNGIVRLVTGSGHLGVQASTFLTGLDEIKGHEEKIGIRRPTGAAYSRNFGGENWADMRQRQSAFADREPAVLVVGAGQAGLAIAARLNQLDVDTLVVEKWDRIGDNWRKRYHSLALHNAIHVNNLPYMPFPPTWPKYIPKDMLGDWLELYAHVMEVNCWTATELVAASWDAAGQSWTAELKRGDGSKRTVHPRHIVFANGTSSYPMVPELPGLDTFKGTIVHSEGFTNGAGWAGKTALILGTGSSAHDIAQDLHSHGARPTIIQRGSTTVVSIAPSAELNYALYDEGPPVEDCDLIASAATPPMVVKAYQMATKRMVELDRKMIDGLKNLGFKYDIGEDATGHQMKYRRRGGGYNLDAGAAELMIKGELGLLQYDRIERFCETGALLKDGTTFGADLIVLATGYFPQQELVRRAMGEAMAEKVGQVWGEAPDGELANMFRPTPQDGLWFIAGSLTQARIYSKYMALQIKARELGLAGVPAPGSR